jgi:hypothetical protein
MLAAQDIAIDRLRVKAEPKAAQRLARELAQATWPLTLPSHARDAWVFVRELHVQGNVSNLRQQSAQALESVLTRTVDGRLAAAEHAQAVRFETLPELLAFLLRDLAQGVAIRKWYWARWSYLIRQPRDQAVAQLLVDNLQQIAAIVKQLNAIGELARVWGCITQPAAVQIVRQMERLFGGAVSRSVSTNSLDVQTQIFKHAYRHWLQLKQQGFSLWSAPFANLDAEDQRVKLAAIVSALEHCPLLLMRDTTAVVKAFVAVMHTDAIQTSFESEKIFSNQISESSSHDEVIENNLGSASVKSTHAQEEKASTMVDNSEKDYVESNDKKISKNSSSNSSKANFYTESAEIVDAVSLGKSTSVTIDADNNIATTAEDSQAHDASITIDETHDAIALGSQFYTQAGGIFYFINAISWLLSREKMLAEESSGWLWLYDLARLFENSFSAHSESCLDIPLTRFIAHAAGMDVELLTASAPSNTIQDLFTSLQERFSEKSFWAMNEKSLLLIPAQVVTSSSHLDIYFPLTSVRLDVRLAGLDVNPGWVPWLGRVVHFHYVDSPSDVAGGNHE